MKRNAIMLILVISMSAVIAGCINLSKPAPAKRYFTLDVTREDDAAATSTGKTLKVLRFDISQIYAKRQLVYRNRNLEYESDFYNEFFSDPSSIISGQALNWLEGSGLFQYVVAARSQVEATHLLEGNIVKLYVDLREKSQPKAEMEIQFFLLKASDITRSVIFHQTYRASVPVTSTRTNDLVEGLNTALEKILTDFENDLTR
jgi:cholesterol transport system auxiliary component